ncbi:MAG: hypothetical protein KCHDKBKB_02070 [Elusimicrobia bacterium]|nr:hypothetical protein [Elusimicrobiota bacterium]
MTSSTRRWDIISKFFRSFFIVGSFFLLLILKPGSVWSRVLLSQEQALKIAFPEETLVERKNLYLTREQISQIEQAAKSKVDSSLVTYYEGRKLGQAVGFAFFHTHVVRTMPETLMVFLKPTGEIGFVELLAFNEPEDYLPSKKWFETFSGKNLNQDLWVKRGVRNVAGATLTTQAVTESVRKILAIYQIGVSPNTEEKK